MIVLIVVVVLVVVSAVPALVLYVLVSGLTQGASFPPVDVGMEVRSTGGPLGAPSSYYVNLSLAPTSSVSTSAFGLQVMYGSTSLLPSVAPSAGCAYAAVAGPGDCVSNGSGWYAVLVGPSGDVLATYGGSGGWANLAPGTTSHSVSTVDSLQIVSDSNLTGGSYGLNVYGTGSQAVVGYVSL
jgi:hypothetical protein